MSKPAPVYDMPHRREAARLRLAAPAVFLGHDGRQPVTLLDVSQTGAKLVFEQPPASAAGFISWMDFETFGDLIWREGLYIGFAFDRVCPGGKTASQLTTSCVLMLQFNDAALGG